jgi:LysM repeat protein
MRSLVVRKSVLILLLMLALVAAAIPASSVPALASANPHPTLQQTTYTVKAGDTLSAIARRYGTTVQAIMRLNGLSSTRIYVGQRLLIPGGSPQQVNRYQVRWGDTLSGIARHFGTTVKAIMAANGLTSTRIYAGQWLTIPTSGGVPGTPERIQFASGAISDTRTGTLGAQQMKQYVLRAMAGQSMHLLVTSPSTLVNFSLQGVTDGQLYKRGEVGKPQLDMILPSTQDYLITVINFGDQKAGYSLYVQVDPLR